MAKASSGGGSSLPATVELLEQSLAQTIERLGRCEPTSDVRTLRIEAIRLRGEINKWRSRSPEPDAYDEMLHRVLHLAAAAGAMPELESETDAPPPSQRTPSLPQARAELDSIAKEPSDEAGALRIAIEVVPVTLGEKPDPNFVLLSEPYSPRADMYRALRRKLAALPSKPRCIALTSPESGEGKSTAAVNLALATREGARGKVLLIEANVRSPALAKALGFEVPACFGEQIQRHHEDPDLRWVVAEPLPGLHIMAVDPRLEHPPLLDTLAFAAAMEQLKRAGYQAIIVDTPSVLGAVDVNMVADAVDGVVLTAIKMKSKKKSLRKAIEQLAPATILGVVVIDD